jgi:hypothetical protein
MALLGVIGIGPIVEGLTKAAGNAVDFLVDNSLLPLVSIIVEPAKALFLNNAINHGVFGPLGADQAAETGQSILFMIETNPGPGLGVLTAFLLFGPRRMRPTVPGAMIIQFLGGIHEIYFPYLLMKPKLILAAIAGGMAGVGTALVTNSGLVATPAPGSIFAYLAVTPRGGHVSVLLSIFVAAGVAFVVGAALLKFGHDDDVDEPETVPAAKMPDLYALGMEVACLSVHELAKAAHTPVDLGLRPSPVPGRERTVYQGANPEVGTGRDDATHVLRSGTMPDQSRHPALPRPTTVAVHDDRDVKAVARGIGKRSLYHKALLQKKRWVGSFSVSALPE